MAPGVLLDESQQQTNGVPAAEPSQLTGPSLDVPVTIALDLLRQAFEKYSDKLAVAALYQPANYLEKIFLDDAAPKTLPNPTSATYLRWSFAQVRYAGELLAAGLASKGIHDGMTIAGFVKGGVEFYMIFYAALLLRCRFSPMNPAVTANASEARGMLDVVGADVVIADDDEVLAHLDATIPDIAHDLLLKIAMHKPTRPPSPNAEPCVHFEDLVTASLPFSNAAAILKPFDEIKTSPDDNVYIIFTSGTSSLPKACPLANSVICSIAANFASGPVGGPSAVVCNHLPIYHIAGGVSAGWNPLTSGAAVIHPAASFTAASTIEAMQVEKVTFMILVPTMLGLIAEDPALPPAGVLSIRSVSLGASTILYTDVEKCYALLGAQRVITSYGMTEGLMMTRGHLPREANDDARNGIQRISAGARLKICKPNSREVVPRGEAGEVHQGGSTAIRGYIGGKSNAFYEDEDGIWCMTGDQAIMYPDGGIQITGRYKDIIIRGGVNVSPSSIEGVISRVLHLEAHVVGMPDSIAGEVPVAIVRESDVGKASTHKLREPIIKELGPRFALEKFITLKELGLEDFPYTSTGKIRKVDLQAAVKQYAIDHQGSDDVSTAGSGSGDTLSRIMEIWCEVAGIDPEDVTKDSSVEDLADSLMLQRYANTVRQAFGRPFSLQDLTKCPTLGAQAELLQTRLEPDANDDLAHDRAGPPSPEDMVHTGDDEELAQKTREIVEKRLAPMGFDWDDVQDVITPSQWLQSWVKSRETSDRFRAAYISNSADIPALQAAITQTLLRNDSFRAITVPFGDGTDIQAILRHSEKWLSRVISVSETSVKRVVDIERLIPGDFKLNNGLVKVVLANVEETQTAGLALMTLHTTFDAFSLDIMRKDLNLLLNDKKPKQHVPYKLWADHLYNQRESARAKASIKFNVKRLRGLGTKRAALWPPQRTLVWQRGGDRGLHVTPEGNITSPSDSNQRVLLDGAKSIGSTGLRRELELEDIELLTTQHHMPPPVIVKAALTLLETRLTGQSEALFSQTFAMRDSWPFFDSWVSTRLPSPLEVTGPALARIAEIVPVGYDKTVMEWLEDMKAIQEVVVKHAHAPYREVFDQLNKPSEANGLRNGHANGATNGEPEPGKLTRRPTYSQRKKSQSFSSISSQTRLTRVRSYTTEQAAIKGVTDTSTSHILPEARDGDVMESIRKRVNFQWLPIFANDKNVIPQVRVASSSHFNEVGLAVKSGMLADHKTVWIKMEWDDGNIRRAEAEAWIEEMISNVEMLAKAENWDKKVKDLIA